MGASLGGPILKRKSSVFILVNTIAVQQCRESYTTFASLEQIHHLVNSLCSNRLIYMRLQIIGHCVQILRSTPLGLKSGLDGWLNDGWEKFYNLDCPVAQI